MKGRENYSRGKLISVILFILLLLIIKAFGDNLLRLREALIALKEKEFMVASLKLENEDIKKRIEELSTDMHIERQLRDSLGMAKEGETIVVLPDDEKLRELVKDFGSGEKNADNPVWRQWLEVFKF